MIYYPLSTLMLASRTLLDNTKSHQQVAETIRKEYSRLNDEVKTLETKGTEYKNAVESMDKVMNKEFESNTAFLNEFTKVMSNTESGNNTNTLVYDYLSHPIDGTLADGRGAESGADRGTAGLRGGRAG